jgi:hypothetical protein
MANWEFLLQKQGDKSWLPLESPTVEILEGHYRLASRTKLANVLVGVQLSYMPSTGLQTPSRQNFSKRINAEGLLIVLPYTHFIAGTWQIECINLEQEAPKSETRLASICFEVQPISADLTSDWQLNIPQLDAQASLQEPNSLLGEERGDSLPELGNVEEIGSEVEQEKELAEPIAAQTEVNIPGSDLVLKLESMSLVQLEVQSEAQLDELRDLSEDIDTIASASLMLPLNLIVLHQSQYLASEISPPILSGKSYLPGELEVILRNPQNLEIVIHARFCLEPTQTINQSIDFSFELQVPSRTSQVMIGEVRLHPSPDVSPPNDQAYIYYQAITLTYLSQDILSEVARELTIDDQPQSPGMFANRSSDVIAPKSSTIANTNSQTPTPTPNRPVIRLPQLPKISSSPNMQSGSGQADRNLDDSEIQLEQLSASDRDRNVVELEQSEFSESTENVLAESSSATETEINPKDVLKSLQADDGFLDKLRSLTKESVTESLLSQKVSEFIESEVEKLESEIEQSLDLEDLGNEFEQILLNDELLISQDRDRTSRTELTSGHVSDRLAAEAQIAPELLENAIPEYLSDRENEQIEQTDHPYVPEQEQTELENQSDDSEQEIAAGEALQEVLAAREIINSSTASKQQSLSILAANEPIPTPILEIPEGEAIAGFALPVLIKLPIMQSKLFVKLWVKDCQTRNIIDGPRWLVDLQGGIDPDYLTLGTTITLPLGVMEVMFEAITVEMQTQRESRKISIPRSVTPPNLSLDDDLDFDPPDS